MFSVDRARFRIIDVIVTVSRACDTSIVYIVIIDVIDRQVIVARW